jgi:uncharacterized protein
MTDLLDASVWIPLGVPDHVHYSRARRYWDIEAAAELAFCRVTSLAFLRHLTNARILREAALSGEEAWSAFETWLAVPHIVFLPEPAGVNELLSLWSSQFALRGGEWTDAYLAAFALAGGCRLVTFDSDFQRYSGLAVLHLSA